MSTSRVETLDELVAAARLARTFAQDLSGRRIGSGEPPESLNVQIGLALHTADESRFAVDIQLAFADPNADYQVTIRSEYEGVGLENLNPDIGLEFAREFAYPTAYPYLREAVANLALRMNAPIPGLQGSPPVFELQPNADD